MKNKAPKNVEQETLVNNQSMDIDVDETAIMEYLEIVQREYEIERNKKQSFENRVEIVMALMGAICIFLFEKVKLCDIISIMNIPLTFMQLVKIISGLAVYVGFLVTMITLIMTIAVKQHNNFEIKSIDETLLGEKRLIALCKIIFTYRDIIIQHRDLNEKRANAFKISLYGACATIVAIIIYVNFI